MAKVENTLEQKEMDPELFNMLDGGLRTVFEAHVKKAKKPGDYNSHYTHGLTVAQTAQALIDLHTKCTPGK